MESKAKPEINVKELKTVRELVIARKEDENYMPYIQYVIEIKGFLTMEIQGKEIKKTFVETIFADYRVLDDILRDIMSAEEKIMREMNEEVEHLKKLIDIVDVVSILL